MRYTEIPINTGFSGEDVRLQAYILDTPVEKIKIKKRPMILICPGGGYEKLSYREGEPLAMHFLNQGYHAGVLQYSIVPARHPAPILEIASAMKLIHEQAEEWRIDTDRIVLLGSSAGAHLACSLGVFWNRKGLGEALGVKPEILKAAGMILSYPVITSQEGLANTGSFENLLGDRLEELREEMSLERQVTKDTPPCFIWHTLTDTSVPVENSLLLTAALKRAGVSAELHIFPDGEHGLSLASPLVERDDGSGVMAECESWIYLADRWLKKLFDKGE